MMSIGAGASLVCAGALVLTSLALSCSTSSAESQHERVVQALAGSVFINELHYDNAGTDSGEVIEVAGPAGTELTGYRLVLYNGSGGAVYATLSLSGTIPDQQNGYGTAAIPAVGLQNGSPDGIALVDPAGIVVQFLSYEGSFTALGGAANGMTSTDIVVSETGSEPNGWSLQLQGRGSSYEQFTWSPAAIASSGAVNTGQTFATSDQPPTVSATVPKDDATHVRSDEDLTITFSEAVSVAAAWFSIDCTISGAHTAAISGGPTAFVLNPDLDFVAGERCTVTIHASAVADRDGAPDPLAADAAFTFTIDDESICGAPATLIHEIQGSGSASPISGSTVTIEAVVVGAFQGNAGLRGFFVQEEPGQADSNASTSEGIFVFEGGSVQSVNPGDVVRVRGTVTEFAELTELTALDGVSVCGRDGSVVPAQVSLPVASASELEALEGMLVEFPQMLTATETFTLGRFGEVALAANGRLFTPTHRVEPGAEAQAVQATNDRARILLDDGSNVQNPAVPPHLGSDGTLRIGDTVARLTGVLSFGFGEYRVQPTAPVAFERSNPRSAAPAAIGGTLRVASYNVLNYFTTLDTGPQVCGPSGGLDCRGANTPAEFGRQREKILVALTQINADIVGLIELENNAAASIEDLVSGLNERLGAGTYAAVNTGTIGTDAIKVGLIYKPASVHLVGSFAILDSSVDPRFVDTSNRPVLAQSFRQIASGEVLTVAVNHLKSKGSACAGDPDIGDGQGNCNQTRVLAARAEVEWLGSDPTQSGDPDILLVGDLNAYAKEDPIDVITSAGYTNLIDAFLGDGAYSFVFDGQSGYLDHALATATLVPQVSGVTEWHINADEPVILDYNQEFNPASVYSPGPFRSADHDPVIVGLDLASVPVVPTCNGQPATIYVDSSGVVVGGPSNGRVYAGTLIGNARSNVIVGTAGADHIVSGARGDLICGMAGDDVLRGGLGRDMLIGGDGDDVLLGGAAADTLLGDAGNDDLQGGRGGDTCDGGTGQDGATSCETRRSIP